MTAHIGITHVAFHLPEHVDDIHNWGKRTQQDSATVRHLEQAGVRYYHAADGQSALPLAAKAIGSLMNTSCIAPDTIDCLIYVHTLQGSVAPPPLSLPHMLCDRFDFTNAQAFSFAQQHCASAIGALRVIRATFNARPGIRRVLLVGADVMPIESERWMPSGGILSDGAFAALIERDAPVNRLIALATCACGQGWRGILADEEARLAAHYFFAARALIRQAADNARYTLDDIQRILPHHLDLPAWRRLLESLGLPSDRLFTKNFARIGHVTVSDAFINLADCNDLVPGKPFLLYAQGVGGFSAVALLVR
jgi:3-oxoacyl-[acyl-carrier-protein] synthase III